MTNFDLEQKILGCWNITSDLEHAAKDPALVQPIIDLYEAKFNDLFAAYEKLVASGAKTVSKKMTVDRLEVIDVVGRSYGNHQEDLRVELSLQDDGKTLKIFAGV